MTQIKITRALLSVSDKTGLIDLANALHRHGVSLLASGGTANALRCANLPVTDVSHITGHAEAFGGRMKTLSFEIASGILFERSRDAREAEKLGIKPIDMVVSNLYPFEKTYEAGADLDTLVENIDIGGPTLIRAAAKNFNAVASVTNPLQYKNIIAELDANNGCLSVETRSALMVEAFCHTAHYDTVIASAMAHQDKDASRTLKIEHIKTLEYGENPHQKASIWSTENREFPLHVVHGRELSWNNIGDIESAALAIEQLPHFACVVVKHGNPCGLASGENIAGSKAFELAWGGDPVSAFGSVVMFNRTVDRNTVEFLSFGNPNPAERKFVDVLVAPHFTHEALEYLSRSKKMRVVVARMDGLTSPTQRRMLGSFLLEQDSDIALAEKWDSVTQNSIPESLKDTAEFAIHAVRAIKSNAIAIAYKDARGNYRLTGMGSGQPNRVHSSRLAIEKTKEYFAREFGDNPKLHEEALASCVVASDAFFPFADSIELFAKAGLKWVVQPGGSIRDSEVIEKANELGIGMALTGTRHFRH
jgi:phosphoribosylaminoimidazolecarboxamide formyltransferase/IMP cyclohydrolase